MWVFVSGGPEDRELMLGSVRELLDRLDIEVRVADPASPSAPLVSDDDTLALVHIDLSRPMGPSVLITRGASGGVLSNRTISNASPSIVREELAHIVQAAVGAAELEEQDRAAMPPTPRGDAPGESAASTPPAPAFPPAPQMAPTRRIEPGPSASEGGGIGLDVPLLAGVGAFGSGAGVTTHLATGFTVASRRGLRPSVGMLFEYVIPFDAETALVAAHTTVISVRALPGVELYHGARVAMDAALGGGVDVLSVSPNSFVLPRYVLGASSVRADPVLTPGVAVHVALTRGTVLTCEGMADVDLVSRQYVVDDAGKDDAVLIPWRVRPTLLLGLTFDAKGEPLFANRSLP